MTGQLSPLPGESAALLLHRLTSYEPGREWTDPVSDPRIGQDLEVNDPQRRPRFYKHYPADCRAWRSIVTCPRCPT